MNRSLSLCYIQNLLDGNECVSKLWKRELLYELKEAKLVS